MYENQDVSYYFIIMLELSVTGFSRMTWILILILAMIQTLQNHVWQLSNETVQNSTSDQIQTETHARELSHYENVNP